MLPQKLTKKLIENTNTQGAQCNKKKIRDALDTWLVII